MLWMQLVKERDGTQKRVLDRLTRTLPISIFQLLVRTYESPKSISLQARYKGFSVFANLASHHGHDS